ncbi:MAG: nucleoside monophosphate kinase [bacterium]|nr:nucleoside monophosphate kinase [bacterium]
MGQPVIILFGPAGSGKGTQASQLVVRFNFQKITAGDLVREEAVKDTERGRMVKEITEPGGLLPDDVITELIVERMQSLDTSRGMVIDGYPRTEGQRVSLNAMLEKIGRLSDVVAIEISISDDEAIRRITLRSQCSQCGTIFSDPALSVCPECSGKVIARPDDASVESVKIRLALFHEKTEPAIQRYADEGKLITIRGEQSADVVTSELMKKLEERLS